MVPVFDVNEIDQVRKQLSPHTKVVITTHHNPDGDAIGSSLALYLFLKELGCDPAVLVSSEYPDFLHWLPGSEGVHIYPRNKDKGKALLEAAAVIFCLDFNSSKRLDALEPMVLQSKAVKILVDHHLDPEAFCDFNFSFTGSCATAEIMFYLLHALNGPEFISEDIATCIYAGIMTDTGSFRFSNTSSDTHRLIAALHETGINHTAIHEAIYDNFSLWRTRLLGYCLNEKLRVLPEYHAAYIALNQEELKRFHFKTGDTEGIVNFALAVKGVRVAALFTEQESLVKISFRSKGELSVKDLAAAHFNGGGHSNAAGGRSTESLEATINRFVSLLPTIKQ